MVLGLTGDFTGIALGWLRSGLFWVILIGLVVVGGVGFLKIKKRRKLRYPILMVVNIGNGKIATKETTAGWFKQKTMFFGLIDYGHEEVLKTKDGLRVLAGASTDFHEINGKSGLICKQKDDDPKILVPISKAKVYNEHLLAEIAPADYRDASVQIMEEATSELKPTWEKILGYALFGGAIIIAIVGFIFASQTFNHSIDKASETVLEAGKLVAQCKASAVVATTG